MSQNRSPWDTTGPSIFTTQIKNRASFICEQAAAKRTDATRGKMIVLKGTKPPASAPPLIKRIL